MSTGIAPPKLETVYVHNLRQRFKAEVNRLTSGEMQRLLQAHPYPLEFAFPFSYLYAWHWLREQVAPAYIKPLLAAFRGGRHAFLMDLLEQAPTAEHFLLGYIQHWQQHMNGTMPKEGRELCQLLQRAGGVQALLQQMQKAWADLSLFRENDKAAYARLARRERERYRELLGDADRARLALIDALPDVDDLSPRFEKLALIPAMGCPQTCRHCMFIWRPPVKHDGQIAALYEHINAYTQNLLFTGGDLTRHLDYFYQAIGEMPNVTSFAILLNGDFASDKKHTLNVLEAMQKALDRRPSNWPRAQVLLQISFDELHQEVITDKKGRLRERIPVANIANIVELAPRFEGIQLALLHKQNALNFSMDLFEKGVFARLVMELGARGHRIQVLDTQMAARPKRHPLTGKMGPVIKDANFILRRFPQKPILLTSSTIDAFGRAERLEPGEAVAERDYLAQVLSRPYSPGEGFDTDLMFWFNGWVTVFSAVHLCLGNLREERIERIFARWRKDPLLKALADFDTRLLNYYGEIREDLKQCVETASSPHQLFHRLTEEAEVRLYMTRRLLEAKS